LEEEEGHAGGESRTREENEKGGNLNS
jgi:hypothetical protein